MLEKKSSELGGLLAFLKCIVGDHSSHLGVVLNEELFKRKATESKVENQVGKLDVEQGQLGHVLCAFIPQTVSALRGRARW